MGSVVASLLLAVAVALGGSGAAVADGGDAYLHSIQLPPRCAFPWTSPDPAASACRAGFFSPDLVLTSQLVVFAVDELEGSHQDCEAFAAATTTTYQLDGAYVPVTTQACRYVPHDQTLGIPVWRTAHRSLIPAGSLASGDHAITWTQTVNHAYSYSLGCDDPTGRCVVDAGTVTTSTETLTVVPNQ